MRLRRSSFFSVVLPALFVAVLHSQTTSPDSSKPSSTFQTHVRVVLLDVVVTDSKGEPVKGLQKENFQVMEDGKPQTISSFEEHKGPPAVQVKLPPMSPNVFTNFPVSTPPEAINVLLLDALNTPVTDQSYVHTQIVKYLKKLQPGTHVAIFTLASRLRFVQGFTTDSSLLLAALDNKKKGGGPQASILLRTPADDNVDQQLTASMAEMQGTSQTSIDSLKQFLADNHNFLQNSRIEITLQAFAQLARYLSGFPGRKNIIWFSSSFPLGIFPDPTLQDSFNVMQQYGDQILGTAQLLTDAQVAIYPIAAEGLATDSLNEASSLPIGVGNSQQATQRQVRELQNDSVSRNAAHSTLDEIAKDSGGEAFYNTNGLNDALAHVIHNGTRYYTITYTPTDNPMDGSYRSIKIKLTDGSHKLSYRRGYFTEDAKKPKATKQPDPFQSLMAPGMPDYTQILYEMKVVPSNPQPAANAERAGDNTKLKGPVTRYSVDFAISIKDLKLALTSDGVHHGNIEVSLVTYDQEGNPLNWLNRMTEMSIKPDLYDTFLQGGLQVHWDIDVPKQGTYLRTGVYDPASSKAGTVEIPLSEVTTLAVATK
jgi:VWFA-related protein